MAEDGDGDSDGDGDGDARDLLSRRLIKLLVEVIYVIRQGQQSNASPAERSESMRMVRALTFVTEQLGPENIFWVEEQTRLAELPVAVLDAIELRLDDDRLSVPGKILEIVRILLRGSASIN
jgi:hypothetical protein